jgi:hypothetical protein
MKRGCWNCGNSMRCDRCGKEIIGSFYELEGDSWEEFAQSDLEMILCDVCYHEVKNYRKEIPNSHFMSDRTLVASEKRAENGGSYKTTNVQEDQV